MAEPPDIPPNHTDELTVSSCLLAALALFALAILLLSGWYILIKMGNYWLFGMYVTSLGLVVVSVVTLVTAVRGSLCFPPRRSHSTFYWLFVILCLLSGLLLLALSLRVVWDTAIF
ncbi:MAG: hypothetical protein R3C62_03125 [Chloroflexota bacterium]